LATAFEDSAGPGAGKVVVLVRLGWYGGDGIDLAARVVALEKRVRERAAGRASKSAR